MEMGEMTEGWDAYKAAQKQRKDENRRKSMATYEQAQELAHENGFSLQKHSPWHFVLTYKPKGFAVWIYNLYPSNQQIYTDPNHRGPFLKIARPWNFLDVVVAAIREAKPVPERIVNELEKVAKG